MDRFENCVLQGNRYASSCLKHGNGVVPTTSQLYMAWLQFPQNRLKLTYHCTSGRRLRWNQGYVRTGWLKVILSKCSIKLMAYKWERAEDCRRGKSGSISRIPQRNCKIKIGTGWTPGLCRRWLQLGTSPKWEYGRLRRERNRRHCASACSGILPSPTPWLFMKAQQMALGTLSSRIYSPQRRETSSRQCSFHGSTSSNIHCFDSDKENGFAEWFYQNRDNEKYRFRTWGMR